MDAVLYEAVDGVATITLNRPETLNAINADVLAGLHDALARVQADESIRVAVLTGAGRGFCSGADLAMGDLSETAANLADEVIAAAVTLGNLAVPTVARIQGVAAGGGFGLAMACDVSIAARSATFVSTFGPRLGIVPDLGVTWHLPNRAGRARALGIAMLGGKLSAEQAAEWGLIWEVVDDDKLDGAVGAVVAQLKRSSPEAMTRIRHAVDTALRTPLDLQLEVEMDHQRVLIPLNMAEGAAAFLERREPSFTSRRWRPQPD